jgi:Protein of unknown function (DUF3800)
MPFVRPTFTRCYVDESIHASHDFVVTAMVFTDSEFEGKVFDALAAAGLNPPNEEYKSGMRMDIDPRMRHARDSLLRLTNVGAKVAVVVGPSHRPSLGRQVLQALQSVIVRNAIERKGLDVFFDREVFASQKEAMRLHAFFAALQGAAVHAHQDSKLRAGIQAADAVAHSFGQIIKEAIVGTPKMIDIGGEQSGYPRGTMVSLGWELLMRLRYSLLTRPVVHGDREYPTECDPAVLDPENDDQVDFGQHAVLLGWGVQVAPESEAELRLRVEQALGRLWLGCMH